METCKQCESYLITHYGRDTCNVCYWGTQHGRQRREKAFAEPEEEPVKHDYADLVEEIKKVAAAVKAISKFLKGGAI